MRLLFALVLLLALAPALAAQPRKPLRVGVVGLVHDHVHWILGRPARGDIEIVGIVEPDAAVARRYVEQYGLDPALVYPALEAMLDAAQPEAVTVFTSIADHRRLAEAAAARGVHVMVEKPLAVSLDDARAMADAARRHGVHLLTNYETTWYPSVHRAHALLRDGALGPLRKLVVHDGHQGPAEIGVSDAFLAWLTDPAQNGAGALFDFGCYGAVLATWLMDGRRPASVTAVVQQVKPDVYPHVDDEATIVVAYPEAQAILQASWNWPFNRKDMEVYGRTGYALSDDATRLRVRLEGAGEATPEQAAALADPHDDPFAYLAAVIRGDVDPAGSLSSLEVNLVAMEILEAARTSARTGRTVALDAP